MPMPSSIGLTYGEIWQNFLATHGRDFSTQELRRIHHKWINVSAEIGWRGQPRRVDDDQTTGC